MRIFTIELKHQPEMRFNKALDVPLRNNGYIDVLVRTCSFESRVQVKMTLDMAKPSQEWESFLLNPVESLY